MNDSDISHLIRDATAMFINKKSSCDLLLNYIEHIDFKTFITPIYVSILRIKNSQIFDPQGYELFVVIMAIC